MIFILPAIWRISGIWLSVASAELLAVIVSVICIAKNMNIFKSLSTYIAKK